MRQTLAKVINMSYMYNAKAVHVFYAVQNGDHSNTLSCLAKMDPALPKL